MHKALSFRTQIMIAFILCSLLLLSACGGQPAATQGPSLALSNTLWKMTSVNKVSAVPDTTVVLYFGPKGGIVGYTGCNFQSGNYETSGSRIDIQPAVTTPFECPPELKAQEEIYVTILTQASTASVDGDKLTLSTPDDSKYAEFESLPPQPLEGTSWTLNAYNDGQGAFSSALEGSEVTAVFGSDGTLSGSGGCNQYSAGYTTDGQTIKIEAPASTKMACAEPEGVMEQETAYLNAIQSAATYVNLVAILIMQTADGMPAVMYISSDL